MRKILKNDNFESELKKKRSDISDELKKLKSEMLTVALDPSIANYKEVLINIEDRLGDLCGEIEGSKVSGSLLSNAEMLRVEVVKIIERLEEETVYTTKSGKIK